MDFIKDFETTKEVGSQVKIVGEIPYTELEKERATAIKKLGQNIEMAGFRKGHVPENILVEKIGDMAILSEMAERAIAKVYPMILKEKSIDAIGYPQIQITKIAKNNPLGFTVTVAVLPEIKLPDYKSIAAELNKEKEDKALTEEELEQQIKDIQRQKAAYERLQAKAAMKAKADAVKKDLDGVTQLPTPGSKTAEQHNHEEETHVHADGTIHAGPAHEETENIDLENIEVPELTDDYVKSLGQPGQFETVGDFKKKLKEHLGIEKERELAAKHRAKVTDAIVAVTELDLPTVLVDSELGQIKAQMAEDLQRANMKLEEYLKHIKKTEEELIAEWKPSAEKRAKLQLVLNEIAKQENLKADESEVKAQVDMLMSQYKDADERRVRVYVTSMLQNESVMRFLENL